MNASGRPLARLTVLGALSTPGTIVALSVHIDDASPEPLQRSATTELAALHEMPWDRREDFILSLKTSLKVPSELLEDTPVAHPRAKGGSRIGWFGEAWTGVDGDGCDTRNEILARDLEDADFSRVDGLQSWEEGRGRGTGVCPGATVWVGILQDPYTGRRVTFIHSQETSVAVQIGHAVPLNYLYAYGAWQWDERARLLVANDPLNLVTVEGEANQAKGAYGSVSYPTGPTETGSWRPTGPGGWWLVSSSHYYAYVRRFTSVAAAYRLGLPQADKAALSIILDSCLAGGDGTTSLPKRAVRSAKGVGSVVWHGPRYAALTVLSALVLGWGLILRSRRRRRVASRRWHCSMSRH